MTPILLHGPDDSDRFTAAFARDHSAGTASGRKADAVPPKGGSHLNISVQKTLPRSARPIHRRPPLNLLASGSVPCMPVDQPEAAVTDG
jgi:hypothetical protein